MKKTAITILIIAAAALAYGIASASSSGPNITTSAVNGDSAAAGGSTVSGTISWTSVGNMTADDGSFATVGGPASKYASTTGYGFSIPAGSSIDGILVEVKKKGTNDVPNSTFVYDNSIRLMRGGFVTGSEKAQYGVAWSATVGYVSYGGSSDLWGYSWTASDINGSLFGVAFSAMPVNGDVAATASVDAVRVTVYYSATSQNSTAIYSQSRTYLAGAKAYVR